MVGARPVLSTAVGSVHVISSWVDPIGDIKVMDAGQPEMTGSMLSTVVKVKETIRKSMF